MMMLLFNVKQGAQTKTSNAVPNVTDNVKLVEETEAQTKLQQESQIKNNAPCDEATIVNHAVESEPASDAKHDVGIHLDIDQKIVERQQKSNARRLRQLKQDRSATYKKLKKIHGAITVLSHCIKHDFLLWNVHRLRHCNIHLHIVQHTEHFSHCVRIFSLCAQTEKNQKGIADEFIEAFLLDDEAAKWISLMKLGKDFEVRATAYAKIIVMELGITDNFDRQIMSVDIGGMAGGDKYIVSLPKAYRC